MESALPTVPRPRLLRGQDEQLPGPARELIGGMILAAGCASIAIALHPGRVDWSGMAFLAALAMLAERLDINLYGGSRVSLSALFLLTTSVVLGPAAVVLVSLLTALAGHVGQQRPSYKLLFNASLFILTSLASAYVWVLGRSLGASDARTYEAGVVVLAGIADFAVSSTLVSLIIGLTSDQDPKSVWYEKFRWLLPHFALLGVLAFALDLGYESFGIWGIVAFIVPALMTRLSMKQYVDQTEQTVTDLRASHAAVKALSVDLERAYSDTLHAIVAALDLRDTETHGHSTRVAELSLEIGRHLGIVVDTEEWRNLKHGAMLHDVGKIGVEDAILRKPGPLDDSEWISMRRHPHHGYRILEDVPFLGGAAELVLAHHERYDGAGYPRGLKGEEIPLGARIFAVADTFDAFTSPRPYKAASSEEDACLEIERHSGTQFDPLIVATFLQLKRRRQRAA